jgi:DNA uptake protein ComE-like DNA-binding protein
VVFVAGVFAGKYLFASDEPIESEEQHTGIQAISQDSKTNGNNPKPVNKRNDKAYFKKTPQRKMRTFYVDTSKTTSQSGRYPRQEKLKKGSVIELNSADTTKLKMLPGVGSYYAKWIVEYRNQLGGFYRKEQLQDVYRMYVELYEDIIQYLYIDSTQITPIPINTSSLGKLKSHPYIDFYKAKAIVDLRQKKGKIKNIGELELLEEFTADDLEKIRRYIKF